MKNSIELNGRTYNALTGEILLDRQAPSTEQPSLVQPQTTQKKLVLNEIKPRKKPAGMGRGSHQINGMHGKSMNAHQKTATEPTQRPQPTSSRREPQRAKTLMRSTVNKPNAQPVATHSNSATIAPKAESPVSNGSLHHIQTNHRRMQRAQSVTKSQHISKFNNLDIIPVTKKTQHLPIQSAPSKPDTSDPLKTNQTPNHQRVHNSENVISKALEESQSHRQTPHKKSKTHHPIARKLKLSNRAATFASGSMAALLLIGFFAYQNIPNFSLRLAANRAGFSAQLPAYKPAGFALDKQIEYGPGQVIISFRSNSDDRAYRVTQTPSSLNSSSLLETFLAARDRAYQTFYDKGKTVYVYDDSSATWVSGGILYEIEGESALSNDQLLRIAASL